VWRSEAGFYYQAAAEADAFLAAVVRAACEFGRATGAALPTAATGDAGRGRRCHPHVFIIRRGPVHRCRTDLVGIPHTENSGGARADCSVNVTGSAQKLGQLEAMINRGLYSKYWANLQLLGPNPVTFALVKTENSGVRGCLKRLARL
jgi:hypothetical protein